jgi:Na+-driven multidrug efflux pump
LANQYEKLLMTQIEAKDAPKSVLKMAGPLVVSFWMRAAFTFVDTAYAATIGDSAVAGIGLAVPFEFIMIALWVGMSTGLTSSLARSIAANESEKIEQYQRATWKLIAGIAPLFLLFGAFIWFTAPHWGLKPDVAESFKIYGAVLIGGSAFSSFWSIIPDSMVKAHQDTQSTMWSGIISNVINLVLNTVFLFVFKWGIFGIALSTVLSRFGGLAYALMKARQHEDRRKGNQKVINKALDQSPMKTLLALAGPSSAAFVLIASESGLINFLIASYDHSKEALAAYSIYYRVMMFFLNPIIAVSIAALPYLAARFGARDTRGFKVGVRDAALATIAYVLLFVAPLLYFTAPWLSSAFAEEALTAKYTLFGIYLVPISCLASIGFLLCRPIFESMQQGKPGLIAALFRYLVLTVPGLWIGIRVAQSYGEPELYGVLIGLLCISSLASLAFIVWTGKRLLTLDFAAIKDE